MFDEYKVLKIVLMIIGNNKVEDGDWKVYDLNEIIDFWDDGKCSKDEILDQLINEQFPRTKMSLNFRDNYICIKGTISKYKEKLINEYQKRNYNILWIENDKQEFIEVKNKKYYLEFK